MAASPLWAEGLQRRPKVVLQCPPVDNAPRPIPSELMVTLLCPETPDPSFSLPTHLKWGRKSLP